MTIDSRSIRGIRNGFAIGLFVLMGLALGACNDSVPVGVPPGGDCAPVGMEVACTCTGGITGTQICMFGGAYSSCLCFPPSPPVADAGDPQTVSYKQTVSLSGAYSYDPDGTTIGYQWSIVSAPAGSQATLTDPTTVTPTLVPDLPGDYVIRLVVNDASLSSAPALVTITAVNMAPVAAAGLDANVVTGNAVSLDATASSDANDDSLTYAWTVVSRPTGSTADLSSATSATPSFTPDVDGSYTLSLVVSDGLLTSTADTLVVASFRAIRPMAFDPIDAEFSDALGRIVAVSTAPNTLHLYDPETQVDDTVTLPTTPTAVSVGPDGTKAVIGHNGFISYVDLSTRTVTATWPVTTDAFDVVLAGNGFAYVFPRIDQWETIRCIRLSDGKETLHTGSSIRAGTRAKLQPGAAFIYGADNGLSPSDIEKYSLGSGTAAYAWDSPYHGDYGMCGDLWMSDDGARIYTRCGNVFRTGAAQADDMLYAGALEGATLIRHADHASAASRVLVIRDATSWSYPPMPNADAVLSIHEDTYFGLVSTITLPSFVIAGAAHAGHGRFVFSNVAGTKYYVVIQADASAAASPDFGVVTYTF